MEAALRRSGCFKNMTGHRANGVDDFCVQPGFNPFRCDSQAGPTKLNKAKARRQEVIKPTTKLRNSSDSHGGPYESLFST